MGGFLLRIIYLKLKNFLHIYSGLNKTEVEIDLRKSDKVINVIIGKMGSCKSVILGHLQPFSGFGTLDSRSQDGIILEGENGEKIIDYVKGDVNYHIVHKYIWKNNKHTIKSFIKKNGEELNPNGNVTSFKMLIELELGIEMSDLSLIRLGPNVTNLIDMSAAERKSYMASRLKDTEIYALLYKKLNEEMRLLNAKAALLSGKITTLTKGSISDMTDEKDMLVETIQKLRSQNETMVRKMGAMESELKRIFQGRNPENYTDEISIYRSETESLLESINARNSEIDEVQSTYHSISEVSEMLGAIKNEQVRIREELLHLEKTYKEKGLILGRLQEKKLITKNLDQLKNLQTTYEEVCSVLDELKEELGTFQCKYTTGQIRALLSQVSTINELISNVSVYNHRTVMDILSSDNSILRKANANIEKINRRKVNLQRELSNMKFADKYEPSEVLYFPPLCPTKDCPYYQTHPVVLRERNKGIDLDQEYDKIQKEIEQCDHDIDVYSEYPIIYSSIQSLRSMIPDIMAQLKDIGALKTHSIVKIFSTIFSQKWYDHDKLIDTLNLCVRRDKYYEMIEQSNAMKAELLEASQNDSEELLKNISETQAEIDEAASRIAELEEKNASLKKKQLMVEDAYQKLSRIELMIQSVREDTQRRDIILQKINEMEKQYQDAERINKMLAEYRIQQKTILASIKDYQERIDRLNMALNDITYSQKEFIQVQEAQGYLKDIVEATSSNKGIPLVYVKLFLNQCKDTVNDLISDVFGDSIEILDFDISETDFKIPYAINGSSVKDISSASQGQRSIISLALSFALVRQAMHDYNIMLLDEMDGPLYSADRDKFISILFKQIQAIRAEQIFLISHNNTFDGHNVNVIMTTEEHVDRSHLITVMKI